MVTVDLQSHEGPAEKDPVLLVCLGEASMVTLGQGKGSAEDKRKAYNS
ncbi:hypothetical protein ThrDRAFT_03568 [Frankia casuarinae]|jgi:hypothetical protein|nr:MULTISPECIES: albusnodin family lasso peptide [Frankia]ETA00485.1 hypothetical protein CcI6DRAFT_04117 [Frankia sp. CcI6]EYT90790.1 hypothetical protein ThrDRAFT_03568 [Frankia casuarinae]KFB03775.1 hypothetical protein ALLO2DRAFT_03446 [Frankia sp. Allo2]